MRATFIVILLASLALASSVAYGSPVDHAGIVKSMAGDVVVERGNQIIKAETNMLLMEGDIVQTGSNGKAGLILDDDTVISMGFNSRIALKSFIFQPNEKKLSLIARIFRGTVSFLSGQIAKLAPNLVHIETPVATIGIRGTHVLIQVD
jgi:hypothetical protein